MLPALDITVTEAAKLIGGPKDGPSAESWLKMQAAYDLWQAMLRAAPKAIKAQTVAG